MSHKFNNKKMTLHPEKDVILFGATLTAEKGAGNLSGQVAAQVQRVLKGLGLEGSRGTVVETDRSVIIRGACAQKDVETIRLALAGINIHTGTTLQFYENEIPKR